MALSKLNAAGLAQFDGDLAFDNGNGIDFGATEGSGASSSVLDDYEDGTWTVSTVSGTGVTTSAGFYTKIGRLVTFDGSITLDSNSSSTHLTIQGLPYTSNSNGRGAAMTRYTTYSATYHIYLHVNGNSDRIGFYSGSGNVITESQFSGKRVDFAGFYYT